MSRAYQFERNMADSIETVMRAGISVTGFDINSVFAVRDTARTETPRVEIDVPSAFQRGDQMAQTSGGTWYFNAYEVELATTVATNRGQREFHDALCGQVRSLLCRQSQALVSPALTLYEVMDIRETGSSTGNDDDTREDRTVFRHLVTIAILPTAF